MPDRATSQPRSVAWRGVSVIAWILLFSAVWQLHLIWPRGLVIQVIPNSIAIGLWSILGAIGVLMLWVESRVPRNKSVRSFSVTTVGALFLLLAVISIVKSLLVPMSDMGVIVLFSIVFG